MSENNKYDVIIVGGGPAGLTASIYASRRSLKTLVIAKSIGGQMALTNEIENFPSHNMISGFEMADRMKKQSEKWGTDFDYNEVVSVEKRGEDFVVKTNKDEYFADAVILGFGLTPRDLGVPGEERLKGRGVTYCATCDGPFFKNKIVGVVGSGNSALDAAIYLSTLASKVYLFHFGKEMKGVSYLLAKAKSIDAIELYCCSKVKEIKGENKVQSVVLVDLEDESKLSEINLDGLFIEIGYRAKTEWLKDVVDLNARGEIITNKDCETSVSGIFAAGDCTDAPYKQIVIAAGEGAKSALQAYKYIAAKSGGKMMPDWGVNKTIDGGV